MATRKLGEVVQQLREARGMTQAQLAERAQLSVSFVSILEGGQSSNNPTPAILGRLVRALGVTLAKLTESEPP
ncbi:MAG: XRE family transcriptional regulator [Candidatus Rokuibacteriota bacterium]|nr:MAG: XRE family transcriptional regulator [Candidatus Rokubacteria bacterium]